jgi:hypothetical protein
MPWTVQEKVGLCELKWWAPGKWRKLLWMGRDIRFPHHLWSPNTGSSNIHVPLSKFGTSYGCAVRMKMNMLCCSRRDAISVAMERWTPAHRAFVRTVFADKIISCYGDIPWPARSLDLSACDFFLWGYLKSKYLQHVFPTYRLWRQEFRRRLRQFHTGCWHLW